MSGWRIQPFNGSQQPGSPPKFDMRQSKPIIGEPVRTQWHWVNVIIGATAVRDVTLPKDTIAALGAMRGSVDPGIEAASGPNIMARAIPEPDPGWRETLPSANAFGDGHGLIGGGATPINMQNQAPQGEQ